MRKTFFRFSAKAEKMADGSGWKVVDATFQPSYAIITTNRNFSNSLNKAIAEAIAERLNAGVEVED